MSRTSLGLVSWDFFDGLSSADKRRSRTIFETSKKKEKLAREVILISPRHYNFSS
jgi:hypothetical protein